MLITLASGKPHHFASQGHGSDAKRQAKLCVCHPHLILTQKMPRQLGGGSVYNHPEVDRIWVIYSQFEGHILSTSGWLESWAHVWEPCQGMYLFCLRP